MIDHRRPLTPAIELELRDGLGAELRRLRRDNELTQAEAARRAGITQRMIAYLERGERRPSRETLIRLACSLDTRAPSLRWTQITADRLEDLAGPHMAAGSLPRPARDPERLNIARAELEGLREAIRRAQDRLAVDPHYDELRFQTWRAERIVDYMVPALEWLEANPVTGEPT